MIVEFVEEWTDNPEVRKLIKTILDNVKQKTKNISDVQKIVDILINEIEDFGIAVYEENIDILIKYDFFKELLKKYDYNTLERILFELYKKYTDVKYENLKLKVGLGIYYVPKLNVFLFPYIVYDPIIKYLKIYLIDIYPEEIKIIIEKEIPFLHKEEKN